MRSGLAGVLALVSQISFAAPADDVRALLDQGRSAEAYQLGRQHPGELGKPDFDFYFGVAAIDSGRAGEGVLALERYIVRFPDNDRARLELARGYFVLGEFVRAREEFETVQKRNPPPNVLATIDRFMDSIRAQETRYTTTATGYIELGLGHDSNVNSGVGDPVISVPTLGTVRLADAGVGTGDKFTHLGLGGQFSHPLAPGVALLFGASAEARNHVSNLEQSFDQKSANGFAGVSYLQERNLYRAVFSASSLYVDHDRFRETSALGGEFHRRVDELNTASLFAQVARLNYAATPVRNADFAGIGIGWRHAFVLRMQPIFQVQALIGREANDAAPARNDLSRDLYTVRGAISLTPAAQWGLSAGATYTKSRFKGVDAFFLTERDDDYVGLEFGASYRLTKQLTLRADYQYSNNESNIVLYQYHRNALMLRARYEP